MLFCILLVNDFVEIHTVLFFETDSTLSRILISFLQFFCLLNYAEVKSFAFEADTHS